MASSALESPVPTSAGSINSDCTKAPSGTMTIDVGSPRRAESSSGNAATSSKRPNQKKREQLAHRYVNIVEYEFVPKTLRVSTGFKVSWLKHSGAVEDRHLIRFIGEEEKESEGTEFGFGGAFTKLFTKPGVYEYYCERHVFMRGEIIVEGSQGGSPETPLQSLAKASPKSSSPRPMTYDAKYQEYVNKRQPIREKLTQARSNRDIAVDNSAESKSVESPKKNPNAELAANVEFGELSEEETVKSPSSVSQSLEAPPSLPTNRNRAPAPSPVPMVTSSKVTPTDDVIVVPESKDASRQQNPSSKAKETSPIVCFDASEAQAFLQERWLHDVKDNTIRWI